MTKRLYRVDIDYHPDDPRHGTKFSFYFTDQDEALHYVRQWLDEFDSPTIVNLGDVFADHADDAMVFAEDVMQFTQNIQPA